MSRQPNMPRHRYVNEAEKADQKLARQRLFDLAQESTSRREAMPDARMVSFLRYHGECTRYGCPCDAGDAALNAARAATVLNARLQVLLAVRA